MNNNQAMRIIKSHGVIEVLHQGRPVWIEEVQDYEARIKYLDSGQEQMVRLEDLQES